MVFLAAAAPGGAAEMKYLAKKVRSRFPQIQVVIGRWGLQNPKKLRDLTATTGVAAVATSIAEARNLMMQLSQLQSTPAESVNTGRPAAADLKPL